MKEEKLLDLFLLLLREKFSEYKIILFRIYLYIIGQSLDTNLIVV